MPGTSASYDYLAVTYDNNLNIHIYDSSTPLYMTTEVPAFETPQMLSFEAKIPLGYFFIALQALFYIIKPKLGESEPIF
jgi:hypothetical protein